MLASRFWLYFYLFQTVFWLVTCLPALTVWKESVVYLVFMSQMTALLGALGGLATVLAERKADPTLPEEDPEHNNLSNPKLPPKEE